MNDNVMLRPSMLPTLMRKLPSSAALDFLDETLALCAEGLSRRVLSEEGLALHKELTELLGDVDAWRALEARGPSPLTGPTDEEKRAVYRRATQLYCAIDRLPCAALAVCPHGPRDTVGPPPA